MIYIHGGAYIQGRSCEPTHDLTNFAKANPEVIVASIDYRVNILGFMNLSIVPEDLFPCSFIRLVGMGIRLLKFPLITLLVNYVLYVDIKIKR